MERRRDKSGRGLGRGWWGRSLWSGRLGGRRGRGRRGLVGWAVPVRTEGGGREGC